MSDIRDQPVGEVMRERVVTVAPDETLLEAQRIMQLARIRHLPVVEAGVLVGVLSDRDVLAASLASVEDADIRERIEQLSTIPVEQAMTRHPETVSPEWSLGEASLRMLRLRISCLPVVEDDKDQPKLLGLLTLTDLVEAAYAPRARPLR
jgi:CBS domain-containing membrane protein